MQLKRNLIANFIGQTWTALISISCLPLIIKFLGAEAYGLVGAFMLLMSWLALADLGMTTTLNREMARSLTGVRQGQSARDLLRTTEWVFGAVAALIGVAVWGASEWLATHWLNSSDALPIPVVSDAIAVMAVVAPLQYLESLYRGALLGLQRHEALNVIRMVIATLRWAGSVAVLGLWSADIKSFFFWQGLVSLVSIALLSGMTYRFLPQANRNARFSTAEWLSIWNFSRGMLVQTLLTLLLTQTDKILLSSLLSLETFGYYMMAVAFAGVLNQMIAPITSAYFPRFSEIVAQSNSAALVSAYHQGAQLVVAVTVPVVVLLAFHGSDVLLLAGIEASVVHEVEPLLVLIAVGFMLNGLTHIPYMLSLAFGWTGYAITTNSVAVSVLLPAIWWVVPRYGAVGAAWILIILNIGYLAISLQMLHRRLLPGELLNWYYKDLFWPIATTCAVGSLLRFLQPSSLHGVSQIVWLVLLLIVLFGTATLSCSRLRAMAILKFKTE